MDVNVYTDGACSNNGNKGAKAGLGVYFGENDPRNCSEAIQGKQTNNTAELSAIIKAADILKREILAGYPVNIYSDSSYAILCCSTYGEKLDKKNWKKKKPIPNVEMVKEAYYLFKDVQNVHFHHIAAHTGKTDEHSLGNEGADKMANIAIGQTECQYADKTTKIYLEVPFIEKNKSKSLGAKWDPKKKKWYIMSSMESSRKEMMLNLWSQ